MSKPPSTTIESFEPLILMSASGTGGDDVLIDLHWGDCLAGGDGQDVLIAYAGDTQMYGGDGQDKLISVRGLNFIDGGDGEDTLVYFADRSEYDVSRATGGELLVQNRNGFWADLIIGVESIQFDDGTFTVEELLGEPVAEYRSFDGTGNNLADVELGSTDERLIRLAATEYGDGISTPAGEDRPSGREISNELAAQSQPSPSSRDLTDMVWLWGQFIDHDISISEGARPEEEFDIDVPAGDHLFDPTYSGDKVIDLNRTVYDTSTGVDTDNPREQVNEISAYIDGGMVYGSDEERANELRSFEGGKLRVSDNNLLIFNDADLPNQDNGPDERLFLAGDVRANENVALTSLHTLWVREHNRIATELASEDPSLSDEELYQQARSQVIAQIQAITYNEYLPALIGDDTIPDYAGYDPGVDPSVANEFSTAAYRFGHSMVPDQLLRLDNDGQTADSGNIDLQDAFFAPQEVVDHGIDSLLIGAATQTANEVDNQIVDAVRNFLFGPPGNGGFDLASLNIQRGRDHGLADYNQTRSDLGLGAVSDFDEITSDVQVQQRLRELYGTVDDIDLWVGGLAEDHVPGQSLGLTFSTILADQFGRIRDGDRFWYQSLLEGEALEEIESTRLSDVIERNTLADNLQENVFFSPVAH